MMQQFKAYNNLTCINSDTSYIKFSHKPSPKTIRLVFKTYEYVPALNKVIPCTCGRARRNFVRIQPPSLHYGCYRCAGCDCFRVWTLKPETKQRREELEKVKVGKAGGYVITHLLESPHIREWEQGFLENIRTQEKLSPNQETCFNPIAVKIQGGVNQ